MPGPIPGHPDTSAGNEAHIGRIQRGWFQQLQALEDAIAYRRARVTAPCPDCTASDRTCDDHACDLNLIADYQQTAMAAILDVPSRIDAIQPGGSPLAAPGNDPAGLRDKTWPAEPGLP
jgi:hypothetical protein